MFKYLLDILPYRKKSFHYMYYYDNALRHSYTFVHYVCFYYVLDSTIFSHKTYERKDIPKIFGDCDCYTKAEMK